MPKITFIGAGSTIFAKRLLIDTLTFPELADSTIFLHDIDEKRLETSTLVANKVADACGGKATILSSTDRREALEGASYVITMIQVAGYKPGTVVDFEIPKKYGLRQTIADTLGIGGIMRGLRTIPVLLDICRDMEELCPNAVLLQYVNPMVMNCWAINEATSIKTIGLCHSVPHTAEYLATDLGVPYEEMNYLVAGINHMAFFLKLEYQGEDLYPKLWDFAQIEEAPVRRRGMVDAVRYEMYRRLGYFVTESSEHFSEYVPWFIKRGRPDLLAKYNIPLDEYINRCERQIKEWDALRDQLLTEEVDLEMVRSQEYGSLIIHSMETGQPRTVYGNVPNNNLITNLPYGCPVELPCLVDKNGIQPTHVGKLPPQLAALMQTNINVHQLTVEAALNHKKEHIYHAAIMDPHTSAELDLVQIHSLVDELIEAHGDWLPNYH